MRLPADRGATSLLVVCVLCARAVAGGEGEPVQDPLAELTERARAPQTYKVRLVTTKGEVVIEVDRAWAPRSADRFYRLVDARFFDEVALYRVIEGFVVQFGISGDPSLNDRLREATLPDEPVVHGNRRGTLAFARAGRRGGTTQVIINCRDNTFLDDRSFAPFGRVIEGMDDVVDFFYSGYGRQLDLQQELIRRRGNDFLRASYPELDYILYATIVD